MVFFPINYLKERYSKSSGRSKEATRNIIISFLAKGVSVASSLLIVPLTIHYVNPTQYGIWLTLSSIIGWVAFFDLGLGNGLKNRFAEARAKENNELAREYLSTTYFAISMIVIFVFLSIIVANKYINWAAVLRIDTCYNEELGRVFVILAFFFCLSMVANLVCTMLTADQKVGFASLINGGGQFFALIALWILTKVSEGSLTNLAFYFAGVPCILTVVISVILFSKGKYCIFAPHIRYIKKNLIRDIVKLGAQFFIIQIAALIQYQMISFLMIRYYGAIEVTNYGIAYKYFSVLMMVWVILTTPLWVAVTDAITKKDFQWIQNAERSYLRLYLFFVVCGMIMLLVSSKVYMLWVGNQVSISFSLSIWVLLYILAMMLGNIFVSIINGYGHLNVQTYASLVSPFVFILTCYILIRHNIGAYSILIAAIVSNFNGLILAPIQCWYLLRSHL